MPGNCYSIRIYVVNPSGNTTSAPIIRIQTGPANTSGDRATFDAANQEPATVRITHNRSENLEAQVAWKENVGTQPQAPRSVTPRKSRLSGSYSAEHGTKLLDSSDESGEDGSPEDIERLIGRLENLKTQKEETDQQIEEEDNEFGCQITELTRERDLLKQTYKEKEESSAELRRHGNQLDKLNRSAQSRRAAKEKQLQQKKAERRKIQDDTARWEKEIGDMQADMERMKSEGLQYEAAKGKYADEKRQSIQDEQGAIKFLEEEIHAKGVQIKALEQKREEWNTESQDGSNQAERLLNNENAWELKFQAVQNQLESWRHALQQASMEEQRAKDHLSWWMDKRSKNPELFAPTSALDNPGLSHSRSRRGRYNNSRSSTISSSNYHGMSSLGMGEPATSPAFPTSGPFSGISTGAPVGPGNGAINLSSAEIDAMTGGAAMSPAANELLPSNLFRDEDSSAQSLGFGREVNAQSYRDPFAKHAVSISDPSIRGPHTPVSASSRTGSILPSPRESLHNLHTLRPRSDTFDDNDRQSLVPPGATIHPSIASEGNSLATNRFTNLFSAPFNRQRGKPNTQEPPPLGTLKQGQSQSFPRNLEQDEADPTSSRRRRGSHGYWANPMTSLLARNTPQTDEDRVITARTSSGRKSRLNMFGSKYNDAESNLFSPEQASSSRPSSTYSQDQVFTRPSSDSQPPWWPGLDGLPNRGSPLGAGWAPGTGPWSHVQSRRASMQHGSTTNLSIGSTPLETDDLPGSLKKQKSDQAPIGTRPPSISKQLATPKLNPAAPSFKTLFSRSETKKGPKQDKAGSKASEKSKEKNTDKADTDDGESQLDSSPGNPRLSRDAQSITTAASTADSHESFDRSTSGTPSEVVTPSGPREPRESLMQKITRKSSSSKFNVPWSKDRGGLFSKQKTGEPSTPGEIDEDNDSSEGQLGKSVESAGSTPQHEKPGRTSLSWPNIRRKSRKGDVTDKGSEAGDEEE